MKHVGDFSLLVNKIEIFLIGKSSNALKRF